MAKNGTWQVTGDNYGRVDVSQDEDSSPGYAAIISLGRSPEGCKFLADALKRIESVGDPKAMRNTEKDSPVRKAMQRKAESDDTFELSDTVHRALMALRLAGTPEATEHLRWMATSHPNKIVRELANRIE